MSFVASATTMVDTRGIDGLISRYLLIPALIAKYANLIADEARHLVHVDTGALKASITVYLEDLTAEIRAGEGLTYGVFLEYGTGRAAAYPFMRPAAERYIPQFIVDLQALLAG